MVALAGEIKAKHPNWRVCYLGASNDKIGRRLTRDRRLFSRRRFIKAGKWHRFGKVKKRELLYLWRRDFWVNASNFILLGVGFWQSFFYLRRLRPDFLFSKGGYVAVGPCLAARLLKIPLILHDSDAVSGVAHVMFEKHARMRLSGFKVKISDERRQRHVGVPVNPLFGEALSATQRQKTLRKYGLPKDAEFILATGGGGGARNLNRAILASVDNISFKSGVYLIVIAGSTCFKETKEQAVKLKAAKQVKVLEFVDDMPDLVRASLGVVTRAGATILTEISLAGKAAIIVPNALLPRGHQLHNARIYRRADAAWLVSDDGYKVNRRALKQALVELMSDEQKRRKYERNVTAVAVPNATERVLGAIEEVLANPTAREPEESLDEAIEKRHDARQRLLHRVFGRTFRLGLLLVIILAFAAKVLYVGSIELNLAEESPLIGDAELAELRLEAESFLENRGFWERHFFLELRPLELDIEGRGYVRDVSLSRDLASSEVEIIVYPKYVLGRFTAPGLKTIVTTDGYAVRGYEHLLTQGAPTLEIKSSQEITGTQQQVLSPLDISFLNQARIYLASRGYKLSEARISNQPREIIFRVDGVELDILALTTHDPLEQVIALVIALDFLAGSDEAADAEDFFQPAGGVPVTATDPIQPTEYIDVRLVDKVIYK